MLNYEIHNALKESVIAFTGTVIAKDGIEIKEDLPFRRNIIDIITFKPSRVYKGDVTDPFTIRLQVGSFRPDWFTCERGETYLVIGTIDPRNIFQPDGGVHANYPEASITSYLKEYEKRKDSITDVELFEMESVFKIELRYQDPQRRILAFNLDEVHKNYDYFLALSPAFLEAFPIAARVFQKARVSKCRFEGHQYFLATWHFREQGRGGLLLSGSINSPIPLHPLHTLFLAEIGGVIEYWNLPSESWFNNLNWALIPPDDRALDNFRMLGTLDYINEGVEPQLRLDLDACYPITQEANGDLTFCQASTGKIYAYAHDSLPDYLHPAPGYPDDTFCKFNELETFQDWVEYMMEQLSKNID